MPPVARVKAVIISEIITDVLHALICRFLSSDQARKRGNNDTQKTAKEFWLHFLTIRCLCRYFIDRHTDLERQFNINVEDGKITLAKPLDRETDMWHNITVTATEVSE